MTNHNRKPKLTSGFTLVETLITIFVFTIVMVGTTLLLRNILSTSRQQSLAVNTTDQARKVANSFINEIRNCAYGVDGSYPIAITGDTEFVFFSTAPKGDGTVSRIRYYISSGVLYKGIVNPSGTPAVYNTGTETSTAILSGLSLGANPLFYYYDGNYDGTTTALAQQVNVNQVKFVKINLIVLKQVAQGSATTFTVTGGGAMRNLKTNLGN